MKNETTPNATLTVRDFNASTIPHILTQQYQWLVARRQAYCKTASASKVQKRPDNVIVKAFTGDGAEDTPADDGKDKAAQSLGQRGGRGPA